MYFGCRVKSITAVYTKKKTTKTKTAERVQRERLLVGSYFEQWKVKNWGGKVLKGEKGRKSPEPGLEVRWGDEHINR